MATCLSLALRNCNLVGVFRKIVIVYISESACSPLDYSLTFENTQ